MKLFRGENTIKSIGILSVFAFWIIFLVVITASPIEDVASFLISAFVVIFLLNMGEGITICENVKRDWYFVLLTIILVGISSAIYIYVRGPFFAIIAGMIYSFSWESLDRYIWGICR